MEFNLFSLCYIHAQNAQNREFLTLQPKESIGIGEKTKITIENYLGGYYFFTIDDVIEKDNILYLIESKHSRDSILPSSDDIKDGLLKLMLYNNLSILQDSIGKREFRVILRLTSTTLKSSITLPNTAQNRETFMKNNNFNEKQKSILHSLNLESQKNNFTIWLENLQ
ncbi:hypothetical protein CQA53_05045 [Helicobacter didelphidarum]|uniref:Uncharacterized protein n=1 Tax=Helicobacter didelphidarum TaxID=2040648 RepID=A0A3D8ILV2_9HELI|nr:hypothetical protein [Helicobacter didelphidarum]RDU65990.1 hypothetical protein CQA53_05045 [Helicobacter didelphidarum]